MNLKPQSFLVLWEAGMGKSWPDSRFFFFFWRITISSQDESKYKNLSTPPRLILHRYIRTDTHKYAYTRNTSPTRLLLPRRYTSSDPLLGWRWPAPMQVINTLNASQVNLKVNSWSWDLERQGITTTGRLDTPPSAALFFLLYIFFYYHCCVLERKIIAHLTSRKITHNRGWDIPYNFISSIYRSTYLCMYVFIYTGVYMREFV